MILKISSNKNKIYILILSLFSIAINQYYGNRGVFPMDSFHFFDSGYRILNGDIPFTDYWLVKGPLLDYLQAGLFYIFGTNWQIYVLHASLFNALITIGTFLVLKNYKLDINYCFFYSILFSLLAYPSSGTPFIDHHSAFFALLGIYSFLLAIKKKKTKIYWILIPIFLGLGFLSKQVPVSYIIFFVGLILLLYAFLNKKPECILYTFYGLIIFIIIIFTLGKLFEVNFSNFINQYILYPQTIGQERLDKINFSYDNVLENFFLIYLVAIPFLFENIKKIFKKSNYIKDNNFYAFMILILFMFSLIFHQLMTKNQSFIFFLIPLLAAFSHLNLLQNKLKAKKFLCFAILIISIFSTYKYHLRYNENRKFHELTNVNFDLSLDAKRINSKLSGLNWITPQFKNDPKEEILVIKKIIKILKSDPKNKMVITNYPFFSVILGEKIISPSRVYTGDGTTHPLRNNIYSKHYQKLMDDLISKNNISIIYLINTANEKINFHYIDAYEHCFSKIKINKYVNSFELKNCN